MASCGHHRGGLNMRSMSRSPPRKAAQVGSLEMAAVAGASKVTNFSDPKLVTQKLVTLQKLVTSQPGGDSNSKQADWEWCKKAEARMLYLFSKNGAYIKKT